MIFTHLIELFMMLIDVTKLGEVTNKECHHCATFKHVSYNWSMHGLMMFLSLYSIGPDSNLLKDPLKVLNISFNLRNT